MSFHELGFELTTNFISSATNSEILNETNGALANSKGGGIRNAEKKFASVEKLIQSDYILNSASTYLTGIPKFVRAILFNKTQQNNWLVTWHQDKTIALSSRLNIKNWGPWTIKDDVQHVQPSVDVLNDMVTFRIHLDDSTLENGCLQVMPRSHQKGILSQTEIVQYVASHAPETIQAMANSALIMRPHLLHSSKKSSEPCQRRVLHIEFSSYELPIGLQWL